MPETFECNGVKITTVEPCQRQMVIRDKSSGLNVLLIHISDELNQFAVTVGTSESAELYDKAYQVM